jgi:predicted small lipoprotein YifL
MECNLLAILESPLFAAFTSWSKLVKVSMVQCVKLSAVLATVALSLGACGVRGSLETPPEAKTDATARADSGQGKPVGATPKPHKEFILDGLLR